MFSATVEAGLKAARRIVGSAPRGLRAAPARAVVQGRRHVRRWSQLPLGLLQQLRDSADAARRARGMCGDESPAWSDMRAGVLDRARRYAAILERLIGPDGSFPAIGRSLAYRCGAFHLLARTRAERPTSRWPAAGAGARRVGRRHPPDARGARARSTRAAGSPSASPDISPASASATSRRAVSISARWRFCRSVSAADHAFWTGPDMPITAVRAWNGQEFPIDHAISN